MEVLRVYLFFHRTVYMTQKLKKYLYQYSQSYCQASRFYSSVLHLSKNRSRNLNYKCV